jgi:hypothetical protein
LEKEQELRELEETEFESQYKALTDFEKNIITVTSLSIEDIKHYENLISRKLSERELTIAGLLRNNGVLLMESDFKP